MTMPEMLLPDTSWHQFHSTWRQTVAWVQMTKNALNAIMMWWFTKGIMTLQMWTHMHTNLCEPVWHWFCGTVAQILTKLNLIITRNGLMASPVKFNLMQLLLKGEALQHFNNKAQELGDETNVHHKLCLHAVSEYIFPKNALQMQTHYLQKVCLCNPMTISLYIVHWHQQNDYFALFPHMAEWWHERSVMMNHWTDLQKTIEFIWKAILSMQRNVKNGRPRRLPVTMKFNKMVAENVKRSVKEIFETHMKMFESATARIPIVIVIWNMKTITWKMLA